MNGDVAQTCIVEVCFLKERGKQANIYWGLYMLSKNQKSHVNIALQGVPFLSFLTK